MRPPTSVRRTLLAVLLGASVLAAGVSCTATEKRTVTVYSGRSTDLIKPILDRFAQQTGISVEFKQADSPDLALTIVQEGERSPADVFISQNPGATAYLGTKGLLRPLPQTTLDRVPAASRSGSGQWVGLSARLRTMVINPTRVDRAALPTSVEQLTDARFSGQVGLAPQNGSFLDFVSAMRVERGDDATRAWLAGMAANQARTYANNVAIVDAVARGEISYGLANHYYVLQAKRQDPNLAAENHFFPTADVGNVEIVSAASIMKSSKHPTEAEELVKFLLSDESQRYFTDQTLEYPVVPGVPTAAGVPPLDSIAVNRVDFDKLGADFESTIAMVRESGLSR
jgi:iron(III) transport system substrate-binding protein